MTVFSSMTSTGNLRYGCRYIALVYSKFNSDRPDTVAEQALLRDRDVDSSLRYPIWTYYRVNAASISMFHSYLNSFSRAFETAFLSIRQFPILTLAWLYPVLHRLLYSC